MKKFCMAFCTILCLLAFAITALGASTEEQYNNALSNYNAAVTSLNNELKTNPDWHISGSVIEQNDNYIIVWGSAYSAEAPGSHPGWYAGNINIKITNVNKANLSQGYYKGSGHYFKKDGSGVGIFGQTVLVKEFGAPSSDVAARLNTLRANITKSENELGAVSANLPPKFVIASGNDSHASADNVQIKLSKLLEPLTFSSIGAGTNSIEWYFKKGDAWELASTEKNFSYKVSAVTPLVVKAVKNGDPNNFSIVNISFSKPVTYVVNSELSFETDNYTVKDGVVLVPVRQTLEAFGMDVSVSSDAVSVNAKSPKYSVSIQKDSNKATVNGNEITLSAPVSNMNGKMMMPSDVLLPLSISVEWVPELYNMYMFEQEYCNDVYTLETKGGYYSINQRNSYGVYSKPLTNESGLGRYMNYKGGRIFFNIGGNIYSCKPDGSDVKKVLQLLSLKGGDADQLILDADCAYYINSLHLYKQNYNGQEPVEIPMPEDSFGIACAYEIYESENCIYVKLGFSGYTFLRINKRTGQQTTFTIDNFYGSNFTFDDDAVYYTDNDQLYKANEKGMTKLADAIGSIREVEVLDNYIYYSTSGNGYRVNKNGGASANIFNAPISNCRSYGDYIYFSNGKNLVRMSNSDPQSYTIIENFSGRNYVIVDDYIYSNSQRIRANGSPATLVQWERESGSSILDFLVIPR